jgi:hypothetical protein
MISSGKQVWTPDAIAERCEFVQPRKQQPLFVLKPLCTAYIDHFNTPQECFCTPEHCC